MQFMDYNENKPRGTYDFPFEFHHVTETHPQYHMPYHWHVEYELIRILHGKLHLSMDEKEISGSAGDTFFISGGTLHSGIPEDCIYECIVFDMNTFLKYGDPCRKQIQNIVDHSILVHHYFQKTNRTVSRAVCHIFDAMSSRTEGFQFTVLGGFFQFFGLVYDQKLYLTDAKQTLRDHKHINQLKNALELLENHYASQITLEELSRAAGMSPKYFCRFFNEMTHTTPIDYINRFRVERSCHLILTTQLPITEIALSCGFNDPSYFIKIFKRYKGITPKKYLK